MIILHSAPWNRSAVVRSSCYYQDSETSFVNRQWLHFGQHTGCWLAMSVKCAELRSLFRASIQCW